MSVKLDLSQFKHVKSDDKSTTLKHKDGHLLTLAHNVLPKPHQEQLKALSKVPQEAATEGQKQEDQDSSQYGKVTTDNSGKQPGYGKVIMKSEGGPVQENPKLEESEKVPPEDKCMHCGGPIKMAEGGDPVAENNPDYFKQAEEAYPAQSPDEKFNSDVEKRSQALRQRGYMREDDIKKQANDEVLGQLEQDQRNAKTQAEAKANADAQYQKNQQAGQQAQQADLDAQNKRRQAAGLSPIVPPQAPGVQDSAQPPAQEAAPGQAPQPDQAQPDAQASAPAPQQFQPKTQAQEANPESVQTPSEPPKPLAQEVRDWQNDLQNGHITPQTYQKMFADKGTLGKIGMIFGMLAGGAGAGMTHGPNMFLEMMNKEIERDLDAQKTSKSNALNFNSLAETHARNQADIGHLHMQDRLTQRELATQAMWRTALQDQWNKIQKLPEGPQKANAISAYGIMSQGIDNKLQNAESSIAARQAFSQGMLGGQQGANNEEGFQNRVRLMRMSGNEPLAKDLEEKHFPGMPGQASTPLTSDDRTQMTNGIDFDQKLHRFINWTKSHSGDIKPADKNVGQAMAAELQGAYRQATHGGVYKEGEQNFISKLIDSEPTKFFNNIRVVPQLEALSKEHKYRMDNIAKTKGFSGYPSELGQTSGQPQEAAQPIKGADGKHYQEQMINGKKYYIPVQGK